MYDAIVLGTHCAGAPVSMLLARKGYRVLAVDRASFPSDTLSTHFLWPRGATYLNRWGLLDRVLSRTASWTQITMTLEGMSVRGEVPLTDLQARFASVHGEDWSPHLVQRFCCPRRTVLDQVLVEAAREAGAEVRERFTIEDVEMEAGQVVGVRGHSEGGQPVTERARIVIGADGRNSFLARALSIPKQEVHARSTLAYWTYYSGLSLEGLSWPLHRRGRLAVVSAPTSDGQTMVLTFGPAEWFPAFRTDIEKGYQAILDFVNPELAERLRATARREDRMYGMVDQESFMRHPAGPGYVLIGDAACFKDQCTAIGITHAFRDAQLAADAVDRGLSGRQPMHEALESYARAHAQDSAAYFHFVCEQAEMQLPGLEQVQLFSALRGNQEQINRFLATFGDVLPLQEFFSPQNVQSIFQAGKASPAPILERFDAALKAYATPPFGRMEGAP